MVAGSDSELVVKLVTDEASQALTCNVLLILMDHSDSSMLFVDLAAHYQRIFAADLTITQLQNELSGFVEVKITSTEYYTIVCYRNVNFGNFSSYFTFIKW